MAITNGALARVKIALIAEKPAIRKKTDPALDGAGFAAV
jgi:hypothetical protein